MAADVAETTIIPRPPKGREPAPVQISRLLHAHEMVLKEARTMARQAVENGDDGTNELEVWFVAEYVVDTPVVRGRQERFPMGRKALHRRRSLASGCGCPRLCKIVGHPYLLEA